MPPHRTRDHSRSLEVTTDVPFTPTVDIVSPTPRAFTFPIRHDFHNDISPSCSPFEPTEQKPVATPPPVRAFSPSSSIGSETSSLNSSPSVVSSQASHRRRRSVAGDNERRPKKGDEDYIKRPENAFILFRRKCCEDRQIAMDEMSSTTDDGSVNAPVKKQRQADLSKTISQQWKGLSQDERAYWEDLAKEKKKEHEQMYPNYVYRPQRVPKGKKKGKGRRPEDETDGESGISFVLPVPSPPRSLSPTRYDHGSHSTNRRAVSAPTPPPQYQTIQLPSVVMPSCPPSPSSIPRISRRTPLPQYHIPSPDESDPSTHFEFLPNDTLYPAFSRSNFDTTLPHDSFQIYQLNDEQPMSDRSGVPLHSLSIPPSHSLYTSSSMVSPADSIASSMMSPAESIASALSRGGPYTPADVLSLSDLSLLNQSREPNGEEGQDVMDPELEPHMGYGGYEWGAQNHWHNTDMLLQDDFDVDAIPPVEIGGVSLDVPCDIDASTFGSLSEENEYNDTTPGGNDEYAKLFAYEHNMSW